MFSTPRLATNAPAGLWTLEANKHTEWTNGAVFSAEECQRIIDIGTSVPQQSAVIDKSHDLKSVEDDGYRRSEVSWLFPTPDTFWLFEKLTGAVQYLNREFFEFDLYGFAEGLQFTKYSGEYAGCYDKHIDFNVAGPVRKLSLVVQLSDPSDYEGGELLMHTTKEPVAMEKARGNMAAFPSYVLHEVTPVTQGTRYSLVAWVTGKPFR